MHRSRKLSVRKWMRRLVKGLEDASERLGTSPERFLRRLNAQHHSIRSWDLGENARSTAWAGWRLLPGITAPDVKRTKTKRD